jgi:predicted  nucleic acid-binding Zn-ribbon protein
LVREFQLKREQYERLKAKESIIDQRLLRSDPDMTLEESEALAAELSELQDDIDALASALARLEKELGASGVTDLQRLAGNAYSKALANAKILKERICKKLVARKFEMSKLERSYREQVMGEFINWPFHVFFSTNKHAA